MRIVFDEELDKFAYEEDIYESGGPLFDDGEGLYTTI